MMFRAFGWKTRVYDQINSVWRTIGGLKPDAGNEYDDAAEFILDRLRTDQAYKTSQVQRL